MVVSLSKGRERPLTNIITVCWFFMKLAVWMPSVRFDLMIFRSKLRRMESKFSLNWGQSSKKWSKFSVSSLQIKHKVPSVSFSHRMDPLRPQLPMSLACVCIRVTKSGYSSANDEKWWGGIFSKQALRGALRDPSFLNDPLNDPSTTLTWSWKAKIETKLWAEQKTFSFVLKRMPYIKRFNTQWVWFNGVFFRCAPRDPPFPKKNVT